MNSKETNKFEILTKILDRLRQEAPKEFASFHPPDDDEIKINQARAKSFIHLFLKVRFGILDFGSRDNYFTDGTGDAGIDAYYIDDEQKIIYFIQSKFRVNEKNFEQTEISLKEILSMDTFRILDGETEYENGTPYSNKIKKLINEIQSIEDIGRYKYRIILLANINTNKITDTKLKLITGGLPTEIYDFQKTYNELVFPLVSGTFFNSNELYVNINFENSGSKVNYFVNTEYANCQITILFVPTIEIAKLLDKYKNSILKFNPRSFLDLRQNSVNKEIANTIIHRETNEFALFNNGITILSDDTNLNERVGRKGKAQLTIKNPQIINGGQTAYTLSTILSKNQDESVFEGKEVLLKVITFDDNNDETSDDSKLNLVESISRATNRQTEVTTADRRSNDSVQIRLQELLFKKYGLFYERKKGEFREGIKLNYISKSNIIDRSALLKICLACKGNASAAKKKKQLFRKGVFHSIIGNTDFFDHYFLGIQLHRILLPMLRLNEFDEQINVSKNIFAPITAILLKNYNLIKSGKLNGIDPKNEVDKILNEWKKFEEYAIRQEHNSYYFKEVIDNDTNEKRLLLKFFNYYKVSNLDKDLLAYFAPEDIDLPKQIFFENDNKTSSLTKEEFELIRKSLPSPPWKIGLHREIAEKLELPNSQVYRAISKIKEEMNM